MKLEKYDDLEMEIIEFSGEDIIATSCSPDWTEDTSTTPPFEPD